MTVSSDRPAVGASIDEPKADGLEATNTAPLAAGAVGATATETPTKTPEQSTEKTTDSQIAAHDDGHGVNPLDFNGAVESNNELPSIETLRKIENYVVLDRDGKTHPFKSLYTGKHVARRVLIIFVRHFFCGVSFRPSTYIENPTASLTLLGRTAKNTCAPFRQPSPRSPSSACPSAPSSQSSGAATRASSTCTLRLRAARSQSTPIRPASCTRSSAWSRPWRWATARRT